MMQGSVGYVGGGQAETDGTRWEATNQPLIHLEVGPPDEKIKETWGQHAAYMYDWEERH